MIRAILLAVLALAAPSTAALAQTKAPLTLCVGKAGNRYDQVGHKFAAATSNSIDMAILNTKGSIDALRAMQDGQCHASIVQADASNVFDGNVKIQRVADLYPEYVHLVCNKGAGISSVKDIRPEQTILVGEPGSGSSITWTNFGKLDKGYQKIKTEPVGGIGALTRVISGRDAQCALFVSGLGSKDMLNFNNLGKDKVKLVEVDDWDFDNAKDGTGSKVYKFEDFPSGKYSSLQEGRWLAGPETLAVNAVLVVDPAWMDQYPDAYGDLAAAALTYSQQNN